MGSQDGKMSCKEPDITNTKSFSPSPTLNSSPPPEPEVSEDGVRSVPWSFPRLAPPILSQPQPSSVNIIQDNLNAVRDISTRRTCFPGDVDRPGRFLQNEQDVRGLQHRFEEDGIFLVPTPEHAKSTQEERSGHIDIGGGQAGTHSDIGSRSGVHPSTNRPKFATLNLPYWSLDGQADEPPDPDKDSDSDSDTTDGHADEIRDHEISSDESCSSEKSTSSVGSIVPRTPNHTANSLADGLSGRLSRLRLDTPTPGSPSDAKGISESSIYRELPEPLESELEPEPQFTAKPTSSSGPNQPVEGNDIRSEEPSEPRSREVELDIPAAKNFQDCPSRPDSPSLEPELQRELDSGPQNTPTAKSSPECDQPVGENGARPNEPLQPLHCEVKYDQLPQTTSPPPNEPAEPQNREFNDCEEECNQNVGFTPPSSDGHSEHNDHEAELGQRAENTSPRSEEPRDADDHSGESNQHIRTTSPRVDGLIESRNPEAQLYQSVKTASASLDEPAESYDHETESDHHTKTTTQSPYDPTEPHDPEIGSEQSVEITSPPLHECSESDGRPIESNRYVRTETPRSDDSDASSDIFYEAPEYPIIAASEDSLSENDLST